MFYKRGLSAGLEKDLHEAIDVNLETMFEANMQSKRSDALQKQLQKFRENLSTVKEEHRDEKLRYMLQELHDIRSDPKLQLFYTPAHPALGDQLSGEDIVERFRKTNLQSDYITEETIKANIRSILNEGVYDGLGIRREEDGTVMPANVHKHGVKGEFGTSPLIQLVQTNLSTHPLPAGVSDFLKPSDSPGQLQRNATVATAALQSTGFSPRQARELVAAKTAETLVQLSPGLEKVDEKNGHFQLNQRTGGYEYIGGEDDRENTRDNRHPHKRHEKRGKKTIRRRKKNGQWETIEEIGSGDDFDRADAAVADQLESTLTSQPALNQLEKQEIAKREKVFAAANMIRIMQRRQISEIRKKTFLYWKWYSVKKKVEEQTPSYY